MECYIPGNIYYTFILTNIYRTPLIIPGLYKQKIFHICQIDYVNPHRSPSALFGNPFRKIFIQKIYVCKYLNPRVSIYHVYFAERIVFHFIVHGCFIAISFFGSFIPLFTSWERHPPGLNMLKMRTIELWRNGGRVVGGYFCCQQTAMQYTNNIRYIIAFVVRWV